MSKDSPLFQKQVLSQGSFKLKLTMPVLVAIPKLLKIEETYFRSVRCDTFSGVFPKLEGCRTQQLSIGLHFTPHTLSMTCVIVSTLDNFGRSDCGTDWLSSRFLNSSSFHWNQRLLKLFWDLCSNSMLPQGYQWTHRGGPCRFVGTLTLRPPNKELCCPGRTVERLSKQQAVNLLQPKHSGCTLECELRFKYRKTRASKEVTEICMNNAPVSESDNSFSTEEQSRTI